MLLSLMPCEVIWGFLEWESKTLVQHQEFEPKYQLRGQHKFQICIYITGEKWGCNWPLLLPYSSEVHSAKMFSPLLTKSKSVSAQAKRSSLFLTQDQQLKSSLQSAKLFRKSHHFLEPLVQSCLLSQFSYRSHRHQKWSKWQRNLQGLMKDLTTYSIILKMLKILSWKLP